MSISQHKNNLKPAFVIITSISLTPKECIFITENLGDTDTLGNNNIRDEDYHLEPSNINNNSTKCYNNAFDDCGND